MMFQTLTLATVAAYAIQSVSAADSIYGIANTTAEFSTLASAVDAAGLTETLSGEGPFTVFAPPNSAFEKLPTELLNKLLDPVWQPQLKDVILYHALGSKVLSTQLTDGTKAETLNGEEITINLDPTRINNVSMIGDLLVDKEADNGVVHSIDTVLTPTSVTSNIVDIASGNKDFTTLVKAVLAADLADALSGDGPFTVFAPTNAAFEALDPGTLDNLLLPENKAKLADLLKYHVVEANAPSTSLTSEDLQTLLEGDNVTIVLSEAGLSVKVNDASVVMEDIIANNGIIHVIDKVLMPPDDVDAGPDIDPVDAAPDIDPVDAAPDIDPVDAADTSAPTTKPTPMPTESGAFTYGTTVAAVAIAATIMTIA